MSASPTRQPLQLEATVAVMEVTKWLKPSVKRVTKYGDSASVQADPAAIPGADMAGGMSEAVTINEQMVFELSGN